jgi:hypothetical protein
MALSLRAIKKLTDGSGAGVFPPAAGSFGIFRAVSLPAPSEPARSNLRRMRFSKIALKSSLFLSNYPNEKSSIGIRRPQPAGG